MINTWGVTRRARDRMEQAGERGGAEERTRRLRWAAREQGRRQGGAGAWPPMASKFTLKI